MSYPERLKFLLCFFLFPIFIQVSPAQTTYDQEVIPVIRRILLNDDSVLYKADTIRTAGSNVLQKIYLRHRDNNIRIELSPYENADYQFFLEGFDRDWSGWKRVGYKDYMNLGAGNYTFKIRYLIGGTNGGQMPLLSIHVLPLWYFSRAAWVAYFIIAALLIWTIYNMLNLRFARKLFALEQIINSRTEDLIREKEKTEALLANVLPKNTASEIMEKGKAAKIKYNFVTVLFSDIQGFTKIAEETNPEVLIDELDKFFFHFDSVVERFGIEKIKTIGDAYMCAGGIPEKNRTNPVEVILAALEMRNYMTRLKQSSPIEGMKFWDIRIGIHTGTVVAGVVGQKKLSYDIWGDTVNTASRMESSGDAGKINISGTTYEFVKDFFDCEYRGKMPVKYKGELEMYFVNGIHPDLCDENGNPNPRFITRVQLLKLLDIEEMVIKMFDEEAPPNLYFHNSAMVKNISTQVELISRAEILTDEEYINLKLASVFLLTGYITDYEKPMDASIRLVERLLPAYGFSHENIEITKNYIRNSFLEKRETPGDDILHDARYDYLGRVDYLKLVGKLLRERTEYGKHTDSKSWTEGLLKELSEHEFITNTARLLRNISANDQAAGLKAQAE